MLYNWNNQEYSGKMYVYCSKNGNDTLASNFFGKAVAWVSGAVTYIGERRTYSSKQYRNITGVNTSTNPATDTVNWAFDFDNFQTYDTTKIYAIGTRTNNGNEHFVCNVAGSTGLFQTANWTKLTVSNRFAPYRLMNTAINLINSDARFVSYEILDIVNNVAYHNIHNILGNGSWAETLTSPTKKIRFVGQSNIKTQWGSTFFAGFMYENMRLPSIASPGSGSTFKFINCIVPYISTPFGDWGSIFLFAYKNIFLGFGAHLLYITHFVNNTVISNSSSFSTFNSDSVFRNNYLRGNISFSSLASLQLIPLGNMDYNFYEGDIKVGGVTQTSIAMLQTTLPNQNIYSIKGTTTLNSDYTLPVGSPMVKTGSNGNNIGAEGIGLPQNTTNVFSSANGAIYRNAVLYGTTITRQQISKTAQGGSVNDIILEVASSSINDEYKDFRVALVGGTGAGQTRLISGSNGTTKVATVTVPFDIVPDSTTIYEILDGEVTSAVADNGSIQTFKKYLLQVTNYYDATGYIINQNVSSSDARLDNAMALTFDMRVGNTTDLSAAPWRRFLQDNYLMVDNQNRGCGDANFDYTNVVSSVLTFRYNQIKLMLHK